jgi:hypothetical protein
LLASDLRRLTAREAIYLINEKSEKLLTILVFGKAFGHQLIPTTVYGFYILAIAFF